MANDGDLNLKLEDDVSFTEVFVQIRNSAARSAKSFVRVLASDTVIIIADLGAGILEITIAVMYAIGVLAKTLMMFLEMSICNMVKMEVIEINKPAEIELAAVLEAKSEEEAAAALKAKADQKVAESKAKADVEMKAYYEEMKSEMYAKKIQVLQAEIDKLKREKKD